MADAKILQPFILFWEGGFVDDPHDKGGATNKGVTIGTFRQYFGKCQTVQDLKNITDAQWLYIFKQGFWDRWQADRIGSQSIANLVVDWLYNSGSHGITKVQAILGVKVDGIVGPKTLDALNSKDRLVLFNQIHEAREKFYRGLSGFPRYGKGWLNRNNSIQFGSLTYGGKTVKFHDER